MGFLGWTSYSEKETIHEVIPAESSTLSTVAKVATIAGVGAIAGVAANKILGRTQADSLKNLIPEPLEKENARKSLKRVLCSGSPSSFPVFCVESYQLCA